MIKILRKGISDLWGLISPRQCPVCDTSLTQGEDHLCTGCFSSLQNTGYLNIRSNPMETKIRELTGFDIPAGALLAYDHDSQARKIVSSFKYRNTPSLAIWTGKLIGEQIIQSQRFSQYKTIVPIPLHHSRLKSRGYNQAERIGVGMISQISNSEIVNALKRDQATSTQTTLGKLLRWQNTENIFSLSEPNLIKGKNIIIVDDVFTTGATLCSAVVALKQAEPANIAIVTLAVGNV